jgi:hypothetical protein
MLLKVMLSGVDISFRSYWTTKWFIFLFVFQSVFSLELYART